MSTPATQAWWDHPPPQELTLDAYLAMPEEARRRIEVVGGLVAFCEAPSRTHNRVARRLAARFEESRKPFDSQDPCVQVETDADIRLADVPLHVRRPDLVVYRCLPDDAVLRPRDVFIAVEVVSTNSDVIDKQDKLAEYARAGIPVYWIIDLPQHATDQLQVSVFKLDLATMTYRLDRVMTNRIRARCPVDLDISAEALLEG